MSPPSIVPHLWLPGYVWGWPSQAALGSSGQIRERETARSWWLLGLALTVFGNIAVLTRYALRSYTAWKLTSDFGSHLMGVKLTSTSGHAAQQNHYPRLHIYMAQLSQATGADLLVLSKWM